MGEARNVYNAACAQIAAALAQEGFEYRPSKHALARRDDDLTREITFQSSFRNFTLPEQGAGVLQQAISLLPLANPKRRDCIISEVVELIRTIALPYLERFSNPREVIAGLISGTMPWWWEPGALEYVRLFRNTKPSARATDAIHTDAPRTG